MVDNNVIVEANNSMNLLANKFSSDSNLMNEKAEQTISAGNIHQAKRILLNVIENSPADVTALTHLAVIECKEGNFQSAREFIKDALIIDPINEYAKSVLQHIGKNFISF